MKRHATSIEGLCVLIAGLALQGAGAQEQGDQQLGLAGGEQWDEQRLIEDALSAAPAQIAETATVMDWDHRVLRQGEGEFTCMPTPPEIRGRGNAPMCLDEEWMALAQAWVDGDESYQPSGLGIGYMLGGDAGTSNIHPYDAEPTAENQWIVEGPHIMLIVPDSEMLSTVSADPYSGGPYVMWRDTPFAHIMLPTGERPEQPAESAAPGGR